MENRENVFLFLTLESDDSIFLKKLSVGGLTEVSQKRKFSACCLSTPTQGKSTKLQHQCSFRVHLIQHSATAHKRHSSALTLLVCSSQHFPYIGSINIQQHGQPPNLKKSYTSSSPLHSQKGGSKIKIPEFSFVRSLT